MNDRNVIPFSYRLLINSFRQYKNLEAIVKYNLKKGTLSSFCFDQYLKAEETYFNLKRDYMKGCLKE